MKLRNKLIPIISTVALASTVTPIVSSCGYISTILNPTQDITKPYAPTQGKAEKITKEKAASQKEIYSLYMSNVMNNPRILQEDIWEFTSKQLPQRIYEIEHTSMNRLGIAIPYQPQKCNTVSDVKAEVTASAISVNKHEATIATEKFDFYTVDMVLNYDFAFTATSLTSNPKIQFVKTIHFESEYHNIPMYIYNAGGSWGVSVDVLTDDVQELLKFVPGWYLYYDIVEGYETDVIINGNVQKFTNQSTYKNTFTRRSQIWSAMEEAKEGGQTLLSSISGKYLNFVPYYLSDVYCPPKLAKFNPESEYFSEKIILPLSAYDIELGCDIKMFDLSDEAKEKITSKEYDKVSLEFYDLDNDEWQNKYAFESQVDEDIDVVFTADNIKFNKESMTINILRPHMRNHSTSGFLPNNEYCVTILPDSHIFRVKFENSTTSETEYSEGFIIKKPFSFVIETKAQ